MAQGLFGRRKRAKAGDKGFVGPVTPATERKAKVRGIVRGVVSDLASAAGSAGARAAAPIAVPGGFSSESFKSRRQARSRRNERVARLIKGRAKSRR